MSKYFEGNVDWQKPKKNMYKLYEKEGEREMRRKIKLTMKGGRMMRRETSGEALTHCREWVWWRVSNIL